MLTHASLRVASAKPAAASSPFCKSAALRFTSPIFGRNASFTSGCVRVHATSGEEVDAPSPVLRAATPDTWPHHERGTHPGVSVWEGPSPVYTFLGQAPNLDDGEQSEDECDAYTLCTPACVQHVTEMLTQRRPTLRALEAAREADPETFMRGGHEWAPQLQTFYASLDDDESAFASSYCSEDEHELAQLAADRARHRASPLDEGFYTDDAVLIFNTPAAAQPAEATGAAAPLPARQAAAAARSA